MEKFLCLKIIYIERESQKMFNNFVWETTKNGEPGFFNTINNCFLSYESSKEEFRKNFFYEDQIEECLIKKLENRNEEYANFTIILGWECNLRCKHCVVLKKLKMPQQDRTQIDLLKLKKFIKNYEKHMHYKGSKLCFVGGEPLLYLDQIFELHKLTDSNAEYFATTNLTIPLTDEDIDKIRIFKSITVSIDGNEEAHNGQRIPLYETESVFSDIIENIKKLIKAGLVDLIRVQAALTDENASKEKILDLYEILLSLGIKSKKIKIGCVHPTITKPNPEQSFLNVLAKGEICTKPCCKYRAESLLIDKEKIFSDFYDYVEIGSINDSPEEIVKKRIEKCFIHMPVLKDENCKKCPVLGYCWGGCSNGSVLTKENPSKFCGQKNLIEKIKLKSIDGSLVDLK